MNRIVFEENPWPKGHKISTLKWSARLEPTTGIWFDLNLMTARYNAEEEGTKPPEGDAEDWVIPDSWLRDHNGMISSAIGESHGFKVASRAEPFDLAQIGQRTFHMDPLPTQTVSTEAQKGDHAFEIMLMDHNAVANHEINIQPSRVVGSATRGKDHQAYYELNWKGNVAVAENDGFKHKFHAQYNQLKFEGIRLPEGTEKDDAMTLIRPFLADPDNWKVVEIEGETIDGELVENGGMWIVPRKILLPSEVEV